MKPKRIQLSRKNGWRMPPNTVVVSRPSKWGNPWKVGNWSSTLQRNMSPTDACRRFETELLHQVGGHFQWMRENAPNELRGKNLACWCKLGTPCHADILLAMANDWKLEW